MIAAEDGSSVDPAPVEAAPHVETVWERFVGLLASLRPVSDENGDSGRKGLAILLSVVVAMTLWFTFSMQQTYTIPVRMPINLVALPEASALASRPPSDVIVQLQGEGWDLLGVANSPPTLQVIASSKTVDLMGPLSELSLPGKVTVQGVQRRSIELNLDTWTSRVLPIRLVQRVQPAPGYDMIREPQMDPDSVRVSGAQTLLGMLSDWPTELISMSDVRSDIRTSLALRDTLGGLLTTSVNAISLYVPVAEFTEGERMLEISVRNLPPGIAGVRFDPPRVSARYRVPLAGSVFERAANSNSFLAVVDYADIARDTTSGTVPVAYRAPGGLDIRNIVLSPSRVEYFILRR